MLNMYYFNSLAALVICVCIIIANHVTLYLSFYLYEYATTVGYKLGIGCERKCLLRSVPHIFPIETFRFHHMISVLTVQLTMVILGLLFSDVSRERDEENISQSVEIMKERILNLEKSKFIGNLSHEARNPLMGSKYNMIMS